MTTIDITIDGQTVTARIADSPTGRDLIARLPLNLSFRDLNQVEKIAKLDEPLTTDGARNGADPEIGDIGYYSPTQDLVLYYGDVGYWNGIVRIGEFDRSRTDFVQQQPDGIQVTIETA